MFNVETNSGIATARVNGQYIDAGRSGNIAGIEFSVDSMRMFEQERNQRHADAVVTLDCTPQVLLQMAMVILTKLELPAFNAREWRIIESALREVGKYDSERLVMADAIAKSAASIENL